MSTHKPQEIIELNAEQREAILCRVAQGDFSPDDLQIIRAVFESYAYVTDLIDHKNTTLARLRKLLFGARTEKTADVLAQPGEAPQAETPPTPSPDQPAAAGAQSPENSAESAPGAEASKPRPKGHGRNGANDYPGAQRVPVRHASLQPGDPCPKCGEGILYRSPPGVLVRFRGQPPVQAKIYELDKFRCQLCGEVFTASAPAGVGPEKYDATVASMIGLLKYGNGVPFNRLDSLETNLGIPLPASTQWEIAFGAVTSFQPAYAELIVQAAQGEVVYNDDTTVKIVARMDAAAQEQALPDADDGAHGEAEAPERKGTFTSGVIATREGRQIALFFSGHRHAGENLKEVLRHRAQELPPPIQMCDALSRNYPAELQTILAHCLAHARRRFVDVHERFPAQCRYVLESLATIYRNDALAKQRGLSAAERLPFHQAESGPTMDQLRDWLEQQLEQKLVEPNSGLGEAILYMRKHWERLTLFLRVPGAPLDNNVCERALKKAIRHRKNSLFYLTERGALVGDIYMSLIHTCELCGANPFDYLTELQRHAAEVAATPERWLPWNYRDHLAGDSISR
jgi:transposase